MKVFRHCFLSLIVFLSMVFNMHSQNAPVTTITSTTASPGTIITLQITQTSVVPISSFGLTFYYDATVLSFVDPNPSAQLGNFYNTNSALYSSGGDVVGVQSVVVTGISNRLVIYWTAVVGSAIPATSGGTAVICDLQFRYFGGNTSLVFDNSSSFGQLCEYTDPNSNAYNDVPSSNYYINGTVSQSNITTSIPATSASASPSSICLGGSSTLSFTGGALCSGATWVWYDGSCGGNYLATGFTLVVTPTANSTYYVRAEGSCNTTTCVTANISISSISTLTTSSISVSLNSFCSGVSTTLNFTGGFLATGANWVWYEGSCGGNYAASGNPAIVSPTSTTSYYLRAEGPCNTTACISTSVITVNSISMPASSITGTAAICSGSALTLGVGASVGSLGTNADWYWYSGSCGAVFIGSGLSITQTPTAATTYFVRAEGLCNTSTCISINTFISSFSSMATTLIVSPNNTLCSGSSTTLYASGGSLAAGASWIWYDGSCGGNYVISGNPVVITPTTNSNYFVRIEGACNTTSCLSASIVVNNISYSATSVIVMSSPMCSGSSVSLGVGATVGSLGTNSTWNWYSGSCGGTYLGSGLLLNQIPTATTTYYLRAEGPCNTTACVTGTVILYNILIPASSITSTSPICSGSSVLLGVGAGAGSLGTNESWNWYSGSCGVTFIGTGLSITQSPTVATTYYLRAEGTCNTSTCISTTVVVNTLSTTAYFGYNYSGNITTYQFIDSSTTATNNTITHWNWTFGDGHSSSAQYPTHLFVTSGTYQVCLTVTDTLACSDTYCSSLSTSINSANCLLYITYTNVDESSTGANDGSIDITVNSGSTPYTYSWSNGATIEDISSLTAGYYHVTVSDNSGCATYASVHVNTTGVVNNPIGTLSNIPQDTCLQFNYDSVFVYSVNVLDSFTVSVVWAFLQTSNGTIAYLTEIYNVTSQGYYNISISITCSSKATYIYYGQIYVDYSNFLVSITENKQNLFTSEIYPNPFDDNINVSINVPYDSKIILKLLNILGEVVIDNKYTLAKGLNNIQINTKNLSSGIYFIKIDSRNANILNKKIVK